MGPLAERIYTHQAAHRLVPWALTKRVLHVQADRAWKADKQLREDARSHMRFLLEKTERAGEVDELARHYVHEVYQRVEAIWRPWQTMRHPPEGMERLRKLHSSGRGVIVNFMHHANHIGRVGSLCGRGMPVHVPAWAGLVDPTSPTDNTPFFRLIKAQIHNCCEARGGIMFDAVGSRARITEALSSGGVVTVASDLPGSTEVSVLGRRVKLASGSARLSMELGVPIVPLVGLVDAGRERSILGEPLDPHDFTDPQQLLQELIHRHEPALLAWPQGLERPLRRWNVAPPDEAEFGEIQRSNLKI